MRRKRISMRIVMLCVLGLAMSGLSASAFTVGIGAGLDPTGLFVMSALAEMPVGEWIDLRAQIGFSTDQVEGLMLAGIDVIAHQPYPPVDPYVGIGLGAAVTPPPFTTGIVIEGVAGVRFVPVEQLALFLEARYLLRYSGGAWTTGPLYQAGLQIRL